MNWTVSAASGARTAANGNGRVLGLRLCAFAGHAVRRPGVAPGCGGSGAVITTAPRGQLFQPMERRLADPLLGGEVHVDQPEPLAVSGRPFKVVHQSPDV